jgi:hypothetical protein
LKRQTSIDSQAASASAMNGLLVRAGSKASNPFRGLQKGYSADPGSLFGRCQHPLSSRTLNVSGQPAWTDHSDGCEGIRNWKTNKNGMRLSQRRLAG